ncbi:MAG: hypothetical protein GOV15_02405 [Candidatus Diapherotrites archaeon]|nr:hypothetical protein [Candidatus Diapherotrites archaeon]
MTRKKKFKINDYCEALLAAYFLITAGLLYFRIASLVTTTSASFLVIGLYFTYKAL